MIENKKVIAFCGSAQSGKDTAVQFLVEFAGFMRVAFADAVRNGLYELNPLVVITIEEGALYFDGLFGVVRLQILVDRFGWDRAKKAKEVRELLQRYGTEAGREIHGENCWTNIGLRVASKYGRVAFSDVRFPNEIEAVRSIGGKIVRINREGVEPVNGHVSDRRLPDHLIDIEIHNNGTLEELRSQILSLVTKI